MLETPGPISRVHGEKWGIFARSYLKKSLSKESLLKHLGAQITNGKLVSVVSVDLDNFKQVNDQHGHTEGDNCLEQREQC